MRRNYLSIMILGAAVLLAALSIVAYGGASASAQPKTLKLVDAVRAATAGYKDVKAAEAAGYAFFHGCVSGPQSGAMGVHFVNGNLVGDGKIDVNKPEALIYEWKNGAYQLVGVEYVVFAKDWDAANK